MNNQIAASLIQEGGKLLHAGIVALCNRSPVEKDKPLLNFKPVECGIQDNTQSQPVVVKGVADRRINTTYAPEYSNILLPNRQETTYELKRRLAKELYKAELDLANGLMIAGKSCDCLSNKHTLELEACAEELVSQDPDNTVYQEIQKWIIENQHKVSPEAITSGLYKNDYPHMALEFKEFRKRVLGSHAEYPIGTKPQKIPTIQSSNQGEITLEEAQEIAANEAREKIKQLWTASPKDYSDLKR
jgi:hypothetical protein